MDKFLGFKTDEILTCLLLIVVGYAIAKMFNGCSNNGFSVGIRKKDGNTCKEGDRCYSLQDSEYAYKCPTTGICHNLVIDDGTVVPCKNPEGVYVGSSNDTYCIQDELPDPNIPVDCEGDWEPLDKCDDDCKRAYIISVHATNGGKKCDIAGGSRISDGCTKELGKCKDPTNCTNNNNCIDGKICTNEKCVLKDNSCIKNPPSGCNNEQYCDDSLKCQSKIGIYGTCNNNDECINKLICYNKKCNPLPDGECTKHGDCPLQQFCSVSNMCIDKLDTGKTCNNYYWCKSGKCERGICSN